MLSSASGIPSGRETEKLFQRPGETELGRMILMEGLMMVPPERGTIIGRALWKASLRSDESVFCLTMPQPRYVVLGTGAALKPQNDVATNTDNSVKSASTRKGLKSTSSKPSLVDVAQLGLEDRRLYISIYKAKVNKFSQPRKINI